MRALMTAVVLVPLAACASPTAFDRGLADLRAGRYAEAKTAFDKALQASAAALANRGVARARLGDLDGAIEDYTRALELVPGDADILFNRGQAWAGKGEYPRAVADFTRAAETDPRRAQALFRKAAIELPREPNVTAARATATPPAAPAPPPPVAVPAQPSAPAAPAATPPVTTTLPAAVAPAAAAPPEPPAPAPETVEPSPSGAPAAAAPAPEAAVETTEAAPSAAPPAAAPSPPPTAAATPPVAMAPPAPPALDSRVLGSRALTRELQGDHAGALEDLRAALAKETDPERLAGLRNLLLLLENPRDQRDPDVRGDPTR